MKSDKASDGIISRMFDVSMLSNKSGAEFGSFRPLHIEPEGGYKVR